MNADEWNALYPEGTLVTAYPGFRADWPLYTRTRSEAWTLGHGAAVVSVEGYGGGIHLTHIDAGWVLTGESYSVIEHALDTAGVFTKAYTECDDDGRVVTVGMRIGVKPGHVVAVYGDTITRRADGTYTVRPAAEGGEPDVA